MDIVERKPSREELIDLAQDGRLQEEVDRANKVAVTEFLSHGLSNPLKIEDNLYLSFDGAMPGTSDDQKFCIDVTLIGIRFKPEFGGLVLFGQLVYLTDCEMSASDKFSRPWDLTSALNAKVAEICPGTMSIDDIIITYR